MAEEKDTKQMKPEETKAVETPKTEEKKTETKAVETPKEETKKESPKKDTKKETTAQKKDNAVANAGSLHISPKQTKYVCKMIKGKDLDTAVTMLENVIKGKQPVKMTALEVGHQKGKGIAGARFPKTAAQEVMNVVKQLKANASVNEIDNPVITLAISNQASAPYKRGGKKAKRTSLHLEARDKTKLIKQKK